MTDPQKSRLLEEFQLFLEQADLSSEKPDIEPDLNTLLIEMAGLKSEVKAESRQFKQTLGNSQKISPSNFHQSVTITDVSYGDNFTYQNRNDQLIKKTHHYD